MEEVYRMVAKASMSEAKKPTIEEMRKMLDDFADEYKARRDEFSAAYLAYYQDDQDAKDFSLSEWQRRMLAEALRLLEAQRRRDFGNWYATDFGKGNADGMAMLRMQTIQGLVELRAMFGDERQLSGLEVQG